MKAFVTRVKRAIRRNWEELALQREDRRDRLILDGELDIVNLPFRVRRRRYSSYYHLSFRRARQLRDRAAFRRLRGCLLVDLELEKDAARHKFLKLLLSDLEASEEYVRRNQGENSRKD